MFHEKQECVLPTKVKNRDTTTEDATKETTKAVNKTKDVTKDATKEIDDGDNDSYEYDSDEYLLSPEEKRAKMKPLRLNDEIEFYGVMAIQGDPSQLRRDTIVGVLPDNLQFLLLLRNTRIPLPSTHRVR